MADIKDTTAGLGASQPASTEPRVDEKGRSVVDDVNRSLYDFTKSEEGYERYADGLTPEIVRAISAKKNEPEWMLEMRLKALETYHEMEMPANWGPSIDGLDLNNISTFVSPKLAGVGAQYDSEIVYHNMREEVAKYGVVYTTIEDALQDLEWEPVVHEYFGTLIPMLDHKFAALHYAVWSGGSFVYVPKGVTVEYPLQSYFRLNAQGAGQFEHTLIIVDEGADLHFIEGCSAPKYYDANLHAGAVELFVKDGARLRYSTIENWSKNMFNLNTKRARVASDARMEWVSGSFGSHVSYLYPTTILKGDRSTCDFTGITFAGATQDLDTGCKVVLSGADTTAIPAMDVRCATAQVGHEATIGRISDDTILYLMSRGCSEAEARSMVVNGFANPVSKELPLEYAVEMNNLIKLEMEGAIG